MLTSELIDESLYASIAEMPIGYLQPRLTPDGITIRRFHDGRDDGNAHYRDLVIHLIPDGGIAPVVFRNTHMHRCFTCDCLWKGTARKCWQCGEKRLLPDVASLEIYAAA